LSYKRNGINLVQRTVTAWNAAEAQRSELVRLRVVAMMDASLPPPAFVPHPADQAGTGDPGQPAGFPVDQAAFAETRRHDDRAARSMQRIERSLPLIQALGRTGYFETDFSDGMTFGTSQFFEHYGLPAAQRWLSLADWRRHIHPDDRAVVHEQVAHLTSAQAAVNVEYRIVTAGNAIRWVKSDAQIERDDTGRALRMVGIQQDITERREAEEKVRWVANHDQLTSLANRSNFREHLGNWCQAIKTGRRDPAALLMIDLDGFKAVNDVHGHLVGDSLLRLAAQRLGACIGDGDMIARLGGDEFAILHQSDCTAKALAARIINIVGRPYLVDGCVIMIGASVGIAHVCCDGTDAQSLLRAADLALYSAKSRGRGTRCRYSSDMGKSARDYRSMVDDLRRAVTLGQMSLEYQPQAAVSDGKIVGFEALLRWRRPGHGPIPPAVFVPVAEEAGLMHEIGEWVLHTACREAASWPLPLRIAVNVSPEQIGDDDALVERVREVLAITGLAPERLELEVTEGTIRRAESNALAQFRKLRALGVKISMDDFGTGFSSLSRLLSFPFDGIKIDRSFVAALGHDDKAAALVRSIADLGSSLAMTTVAEGVETEAQAIMVRANGFTDMQGFLISRPMSVTLLHRYMLAEARQGVSSDNTDAIA
jgi:diguanylate cyclase (GGDEF)-like protein